MRWIRKIRLRFRSLFERSRVEGDLEDELRDFVEREMERQIATGLSPEEARRLALSSLHGAERIKEECRDARGIRWLDETLGDLRFAVRTLQRAPVFALTVIAALAFCIGANTAIFSVVDTVLFRPLPFPDQQRLVSVTEGLPAFGFPVTPFAIPDYLFVAANNRSFEATATYHTESYEISGAGEPRRVKAARVTASLFHVMQVEPLIGRAFTQEEDDSAKQVVVLDYGFAESLFAEPKRALGRAIHLDRKPYTVIGIMPRSFSFPIRGLRFNGDAGDLFIPVSWSKEDRRQSLNNFDYSMIARLRPNVTAKQANADVRALLKRVAEDYPPEIKAYIQQRMPNFTLESQTIPFREEFTGDTRRPLLLLLGAVGIVLFIGCADVANLMFSRMVGRQREFALRSALGAGSWRLARQTITEGLVLSLTGGAIGFGLALWALPLLIRFAPDNLPRLNEVGLNWRVTAFVITVTLATPLFFCLAPLLNTIHSALASQFRGEGRTITQGKRQRLLMSGGVVVQFSLAFVLLAAAGLLMRSFLKAIEADPGFLREHLISVRIALPNAVYSKSAQVSSFFNGLLSRLNTLPGVQQTGAVSDLPMGSTSNRVYSFEGHGITRDNVNTIFCVGNALESLGVRLVRGRLLEPADEFTKQHVAVISESLAKRMLPHEDPIGRHVKSGVDAPMNTDPWVTIVGVVKDVKERLTSNSPRLQLFTTREDWVNDMNVLVRTSRDPAWLAGAIRREVNRVDPSLPVAKLETLDQILDESLSAERFRTWLFGSFALAALFLALLGIAGLLAYNAEQRTQEFGVRIALGADRRHLLLLVLKQSLRLSGTGIAIGLITAMLVTRALSALLYNTSPLDTGTFLCVPLIPALVALAAGMFPAWRAVHTDPITALRAS
ncbi:MAG: ABC transporter permease [Acidobacteriaceae bacterium]|nr:ABC transporter permease [Acidobacteriaceae bacterium]MBV9780843.1 ABC transporter permease [Acidobacteriaceae bacterium]